VRARQRHASAQATIMQTPRRRSVSWRRAATLALLNMYGAHTTGGVVVTVRTFRQQEKKTEYPSGWLIISNAIGRRPAYLWKPGCIQIECRLLNHVAGQTTSSSGSTARTPT